jgi:NADPH:quinone reductase-like Zn-dependent oxidoreductase
MIAAVAERYGSADVIAIRDIPDPAPRPHQVRVRVRASSLNPIDAKLRSGSLRPFLQLRFPAVLGYDVAGEVEAVGTKTEGFKLGERVYGRVDRTTGGAHAQRAVVSARVLDRIPDRLDFVQAAALPLTAMTALQALRDIAHLREGQSLLVVGGVGGVGSHALQIGRAMGAEVVAVVSSSGASLARSLGAAETVDYTQGELERHRRRYDVIFDTVFQRSYRNYERLLEKRGRYVTTGLSPGLVLRSILTRRYGMVISQASGERMRSISALVHEGRLEPVIDSTFPLEQIRDAYHRLEQGHLRGKVVLTIS